MFEPCAVGVGTPSSSNAPGISLVVRISLLLFALGISAEGNAQTFWTAGTGNWNTASNWSLGVPNAGSGTTFDAVIDNGGTAQLTGAPPGSVRRLRVGRIGGPGNLIVDATTLNITENLHLNETSNGPASVIVRNGASVTSPSTIVGYSSASNTSFLITGPGTTYNASTQFVVGNTGVGIASLNIENGAALTSAAGFIGNSATAVVRNLNSQWTSSGNFTVGNVGVGTLTIQDQGLVRVESGLTINAGSAVNLDGGTLRFNTINAANRLNFSSGTLQLAGDRTFGVDATISTLFGAAPTIPVGKNLSVEGSAIVQTGTTVASSLSTGGIDVKGFGGANPLLSVGSGASASGFSVLIGNDAGSQGTLNVNGPGASLTGGIIWVGINGGGTMNITGGATVESTVTNFNMVIALNAGSAGTVNVSGAGTKLSAHASLALGGPGTSGTGVLNIDDQATVHVNSALQINAASAVNLNGGTLRFNTISGLNRLFFNSGTIQLAGNRNIGTDSVISPLFGSSPTLVAGYGLTVEGTANLLAPVRVDGGTFTAGQLTNSSNLALQRGTFNLTNQSVTIVTGGLLGSSLELGTNMTVNVSLGVTNQGLVTGDGQLGGTFSNSSAGELRAEPGKSLKLTGANNTNAGQVNLFGGQLEFTQDCTNSVGGFVSGNGTLITRAGLTNQGTMNFGGATNLVGDVTNASGAKIYSSGGGPTTFYDDVVNNGEIRTGAGSFTTFFGSVSGSGTFSGPGTVDFEGDLKPGNSPGTIEFGGNVSFGENARLVVEIGGPSPGSQYDVISVAGELSLGGTLVISLIDGFVPAAGQVFNFFAGSNVSGGFESIELPTLPGLSWDTSDLAAGSLTLVAGLPGDYNQNGVVDAADYTRWRDAFGNSGPLPNDDTPGVGADDYTRWQTHFGQTGGSGAQESIGAVPEPATSALIAVAVSLCAIFRARDARRAVNLA